MIGFIKVKNLLEFNINDPKPLEKGNVINRAIEMKPKTSLLDAIDTLKDKKINFAIINTESGRCKGIITLKQIFEKLVLK